jgi:uncharacterized protein (DUF305 family)
MRTDRHLAPRAAGALLAAFVALSPATPQAQQQHQPGMQHGMGMDMPMTGDPDVDFARMMIPHHQGAIDMARVQLEKGRDPRMRDLAQKIIADQEREIGILNDWLAQHPK